MSLCDQMRQIRHLPIQEQVDALRNSPWALLTALQEISEHCRGCTGLLSVTGARCSVAAAGQAVTLPGPPSIGSRRGSLCSDHDCGCPTGRCRLSQCLESTPEERSAGNLHATFCGGGGRRLPPSVWKRSHGRTSEAPGRQQICSAYSHRATSRLYREGQFVPPRLSGRSAFSKETFAGRCGNE